MHQTPECRSASATNSPTSTTPIRRRPPLALLKRGTSVIPSPEVNSATSSRESAFSFHQNPRTSLLFGKNNVFAYEDDKEKPGYLSLLQDVNRLLILKWTPNALLHSEPSKTAQMVATHLMAVSIKMETITHLHLHQNDNCQSISVVLINSDGIQQFSFKFTLRQHCKTFLNSLEIGLSPLFRIDPSLDSIKSKETLLSDKNPQNGVINSEYTNSSDQNPPEKTLTTTTNSAQNSAAGLVFRIISFAANNYGSYGDGKTRRSSRTISRASTQDSSSKESSDKYHQNQSSDLALRDSLVNATRAMRNQILGRAFYGWLSYCRHLRTIRTNLANIMLPSEEFPVFEPDDKNSQVNEVFWRICRAEKSIPLYKQFLMRVYFYGIEPELRPLTWPYLLRVVEWHEDLDVGNMDTIKKDYERDTTEWLEIELELIEMEKNGNGGGRGEFLSDIPRQNSEYGADNRTFKDFPTAFSGSICNDVFEDPTESSPSPVVDFNGQQMDEKSAMIKEFGANLSRIQKDVDRCDRTTRFYSKIENLELLRRLMCTYVYRRLKIDLNDGYVQGMCDLMAPLLVVFGDDAITLACFERLMRRMARNFPQHKQINGGMEDSLNHFRCLVEVMEPELYGQLMRNVDYSFVVFYRWLLLDFKRELLYNEVFQLWEVIWAAEMLCTRHFTLFFGLALLTQYREILIENEMDFTDVIKFFNEMAEKHDVRELLDITRKKIRIFQEIMQDLNKSNKD